MRSSRLAFSCVLLLAAVAAGGEVPWKRHTIDAGSRGADGVKLADLTGDGLPDIVTGWEEGGAVRIAIHPGKDRAREPWTVITAGTAPSVEDALPADLDGDGAIDIVSACEGGERTLHVHWAPRDRGAIRDGTAWRRESFPFSRRLQMWMFIAAADIDGRRGVDLVAGGKGPGASLGWIEAPGDPRDLAAWRWRRLREVGWTMSIVPLDMDGDGDRDILFTDRKGPRSGCGWLENPRRPGREGGGAVDRAASWIEHPIGGAGKEAMFLTAADLDGDGLRDILVAVKPRGVLFCRALSSDGLGWATPLRFELPGTAGTAKAVAAGDLDLDGRMEIAVTCEEARGKRSGVWMLSWKSVPGEDPWWEAADIGGPEGTKYDLVELLDLDGDGDLDLLTCEEADGLGVVWYENPARAGRS